MESTETFKESGLPPVNAGAEIAGEDDVVGGPGGAAGIGELSACGLGFCGDGQSSNPSHGSRQLVCTICGCPTSPEKDTEYRLCDHASAITVLASAPQRNRASWRVRRQRLRLPRSLKAAMESALHLL